MFRYESQKGKNRVHLEGELTIYKAAELKKRLMAVLDDLRDLEIDLGNVSEIDSAGVQLLMLAKKECERGGRALSLTSHSSAVLDAFDLMGLIAYFNDPVILTGKQGEPHES